MGGNYPYSGGMVTVRAMLDIMLAALSGSGW